MEQSKTKTTAVAIQSAVPLSKDTWQIDWQERSWDRWGSSGRGALGGPEPAAVMPPIFVEPLPTQKTPGGGGIVIPPLHLRRSRHFVRL